MGHVARSADDPTSDLLIEHVNAYRQPPPLAAQSKVKVEIQRLVAEGIEPDRIRRGLTRIREKELSASLLPQLVSEAEPVVRRGTADERVAGWLDIAEKFATPTPPTAPKGITA